MKIHLPTPLAIVSLGKPLRLLLLLGCITSLLAEEISIRPESEADFGSGATVRQDYYIPGAYGAGMFIGHPNPNTRGDRALVRFNLAQLLLKSKKIEKVELLIWLDKYFTEEEGSPREIAIEHCLNPVETLDGAAVASLDVDPVGTLEVHQEDMLYPNYPYTQMAENIPGPVRIDVTSFIKADLDVGMASATFRIKDVRADVGHNETGGGVGVVISTEEAYLPELAIELK